MWHPEPARLAALRARIANEPAEVHQAIDDPAFVATFGDVHGDSLKRVPAGYPQDHPDAALLKLKDFTFGRRLSDDEALSADLPHVLADALADAGPGPASAGERRGLALGQRSRPRRCRFALRPFVVGLTGRRGVRLEPPGTREKELER